MSHNERYVKHDVIGGWALNFLSSQRRGHQWDQDLADVPLHLSPPLLNATP